LKALQFAAVRPLRWPVLGLGVLSVVLWLASYSWLLGLTPPLEWVSPGSSPWFVAEAAAVVVGAVAVVGGLLLLRTARRAAWWAIALGAVAAGLSLLSIAWPV
jgi:hypothetical protein